MTAVQPNPKITRSAGGSRDKQVDGVSEGTDDIGSALRMQREAAGRTLREIADATKLGVRTLDALERNQVDRLPPGIFRRSVVRAYAREIGIDPEVTLQAFLALHPDGLPPPGRQTGPVADVAMRPPHLPPATVAAIAVAIAVAAVLLLLGCLLWPRGAVASHGAALSRPSATAAARPAR